MTDVDLPQIIDLIQQLGIWIIFAWLYLQEKQAHQATREQYRDDLREIASLRQNLTPIRNHTLDDKQPATTPEIKTGSF